MSKTGIIATAFMILFALSACVQQTTPPHIETPTDLPSLIAAINLIDTQYNTVWKEEQLEGKMVALADIERARADFEEVLISVENKTILEKVLKARIAMLNSEEHYQRFLLLDPSGLKSIEYTKVNGSLALNLSSLTPPNCTNTSRLVSAIEELQSTLSEGHKFTEHMDFALQSSAEARELIGVNKNRPLFYDSRLGDVKLTSEINRALMSTFCTEA